MIKNEKGECMIEHHIHYKEIDGYDETVWMPAGEHIKLHQKLRKEGKCNISVKKMRRISNAANQRTKKARKYRGNNRKKLNQKSNEYYYNNRKERNQKSKKYYEENKEKIKEYQKEWKEKNPDYFKRYNKEYYIRKNKKV